MSRLHDNVYCICRRVIRSTLGLFLLGRCTLQWAAGAGPNPNLDFSPSFSPSKY